MYNRTFVWSLSLTLDSNSMKTSVNLPDDVPNEVWEKCWNRVTRADLKSLSCVCQRFRSICQSLLFKSFTISISRIVQGPMFSLSKSNMTIIQEKIEGLQGVISNPSLVNSVHRLIISTIHLETAINGADNLFENTESAKSPLSTFLTNVLTNLPAFSKTKALIHGRSSSLISLIQSYHLPEDYSRSKILR